MRGSPVHLFREAWEHELNRNIDNIYFRMKMNGWGFHKSVVASWSDAEPLFSFMGENFYCEVDDRSSGADCGCLTQWRRHPEYYAHPNEFTLAISKDERLPKFPGLITEDMLPLFKAWQLAKWDYYYADSWSIPA